MPGVQDCSLPEELLLLLHKPNGRAFVNVDSHAVVAAAEVAELVLRGRVELRGKLLGTADLVLLDRGTTEVEWLDRDLELLAFWMRSRSASISLRSWFPLRRTAFTEHRARLCAAGSLEYRRDRLFGFLPYERYFPLERERGARLEELFSVARGEKDVDDRTVLLVALAHSSGLCRELGFERPLRKRLRAISRGELAGEAASDSAVVSGELLGRSVTPQTRTGGAGGGGGGGGGD